MNVNRKILSSALDQVKPALAGKSIIPGLENIWFDGATVHAFNGVISIESRFKSPVKGGVVGDIFTKFIASVTTDEVNLESSNALKITAGKAKLTLPLMELEASAREFPDDIDPTDLGEDVSKEFVDALTRSLISVDKNSSLAAYSGVLMEPGDGEMVHMFSTDSKSLTWEAVKTPISDLIDGKVLLPGEFCTQLLRLYEDESLIVMTDGYAAFGSTADTILMSSLLDHEGAPNYRSAVQKHLSDVTTYSPIPPGLVASLERCVLVKPDRSEDPVVLNIKDGVLDIAIETRLGAANDQIEVDHPDIRVVLDPSLMLRAIPEFKEFVITPDAFILHGEGTSYHLISTM